MRAHSHLISGTFITTTVAAADWCLLHSSNSTTVHVGEMIKNFFIPDSISGMLWFIAYLAGGVLLLYLGMLLPDCDLQTSTIGRVFYIPARHRTWVHALWIPMIFLGISYWLPIFRILTLGYIEHLWCDSLSVGGICWFYPIGSRNGKPKRHLIGLYNTGEISETIVMVLICVVCGISDWLLIFGNKLPWQ